MLLNSRRLEVNNVLDECNNLLGSIFLEKAIYFSLGVVIFNWAEMFRLYNKVYALIKYE